MADTKDTRKETVDGATSEQLAQIKDLVPTASASWLGLLLVAMTLLVFYVQVKTWPVSTVKDASGKDLPAQYEPFSLFGCEWTDVSPDTRLLIAVLMAGALGSLIHALTSFADYAANKQLGWSWVLWIFMRVPTGMALALAFYFVVRGGFVSSVSSGAGTPYAYAGLAALVGMFALQTTDKLKEIFEILFTQKNPVNRQDPLTVVKLAIDNADPATLTIGKATPVILLNGRGFVTASTVTINGKLREPKLIKTGQLQVKLDPEDSKEAGELTLVVSNPEPNASTARIVIRVAPAITGCTPALLDVDQAKELKVEGAGFHADCKAKIGGQARATKVESPTKLTVTPVAADVRAAGELQLVAENPQANGGASNAIVIKVVKPASGVPVAPPAPAPAAPTITGTDPSTLEVDQKTRSLIVIGTGFLKESTAIIGGETRDTAHRDDKKVIVTLKDEDVVKATTLKLTVRNSETLSNIHDIEVK